jgi:hypothetical protein
MRWRACVRAWCASVCVLGAQYAPVCVFARLLGGTRRSIGASPRHGVRTCVFTSDARFGVAREDGRMHANTCFVRANTYCHTRIRKRMRADTYFACVRACARRSAFDWRTTEALVRMGVSL